jgi:hypothetical protein
MRVIGRAADEALVCCEARGFLVVHVGDDLADLGHGLRANAIAWKKKKRACCHFEVPGPKSKR